MARPRHNLDTQPHHNLVPLSTTCLSCGHAAHIAYHTQRTITTLAGQHHLHVVVRRCTHPACSRSLQSYRPEAEGVWALPHGEYGLDVIALIRTVLPSTTYSPEAPWLTPMGMASSSTREMAWLFSEEA